MPVVSEVKDEMPKAGGRAPRRKAGVRAAAHASVAPDVIIDLEPPIAAYLVPERVDITLRGRVSSRLPLETLTLSAGGADLINAEYGQPERAVVINRPGDGDWSQREFLFQLPLARELAAGELSCRLTAHTAAGVENRDFILVIATGDIPEASILPLVTAPLFDHAGGYPPILLCVERAAVWGDGHLSLQGWAVSMTPVIAIQAYLGEDRIAAAKVGVEREDVARAHPAYLNAGTSGFGIDAHVDSAILTAPSIRIRLIGLHGFTQEVTVPLVREAAPRRRVNGSAPEQPIPVAAPEPVPTPPAASTPDPVPAPGGEAPSIGLFCDVAALDADGQLRVEGWAVSGAGVIQVQVSLDDQPLGVAELGHERPDVGELFTSLPMARLSGFRFMRHGVTAGAGEPIIRVLARDSLGLEQSVGAPLQIEARPEPVAPPAAPAAAQPEPSAEEAHEFRFELDRPNTVDGLAIDPVSGRLSIEGWVLSRSGLEGIDIVLDGRSIGQAHHGLARQDVALAFPDWPSGLRSGFVFHVPARGQREGEHHIRLTVKATSGLTMTREFRFNVSRAGDVEGNLAIRRRVPPAEADMAAAALTRIGHHPIIHTILCQVGPVDKVQLRTTLISLRHQSLPGTPPIILADGPGAAAGIREIVAETVPWWADEVEIRDPDGAAEWKKSILPASLTSSDYVMVLCAGDELAADAFVELALSGARHPDSAMFYADEIRTSPVSQLLEPFFKPDFSPDLLLSTNYIGRPWMVRGNAFARLGVTPGDVFQYGDYDLVLRCAEQAGTIQHVSRLLCQRGPIGLSSTGDDGAGSAALERAFHRRGISATAVPSAVPGTWRSRREVTAKGKVSIIIPTMGAHGYIRTCLNSMREHTRYKNFEVVCIENIPESDRKTRTWLRRTADKMLTATDAFNWSRFNNRAAAASDGEYLLFLNDDIEFLEDGWLDALLEHVERPEVGLAGARLLFPDRTVQHAGMFLTSGGIGRHAFRHQEEDDPGYFGLALTQRNVMAVTGACMLMRREVFERLGRFDEAHEIVNNDLDFCLKVHQAGLLTVYTPYATMIHHERASRDEIPDHFDVDRFNTRWKTCFAAGDPYFNPRLSLQSDECRPDHEPVQTIYPGNPVFRREDIRRILVVKLDHIGDFIVSLPAIRHLKTIFPGATITVLAGPASRAFAGMEPAIDEFLTFEFFHARSQLGERGVTKEELTDLAARLAPYQFDLAVDLRKHLSTREVLRYTGARYLAGFDHLGQAPFLDVALEWDSDRALSHKRLHVTNDLLNLTGAIDAAAGTGRTLFANAVEPLPLESLPAAIQPLFRKAVVAIHPGAGNITKQWPARHFSALIDLLIERADVNVILVGGPDERAVAQSILDSLLRPDAAASVAGDIPLALLPRLLAGCALYIGNDSGPKHIAAAVGMPVIGIHSGVVDAKEWGPLGPNAVALWRDMSCGPCYLEKAEDCPRALACLRELEPAHVFETAGMLLAGVKRPDPPAAPAAVAPERPRSGAGKRSKKR